MYKVTLHRTPDISWVLDGKNCMKLYAMQDIDIQPHEIKLITFNEMRYELENCIGLPYIKKSDNVLGYTLYHTDKTFKWQKQGVATLPIHNPSNKTIHILQGTYLATVRFMSISFYNLWKKHDRSDDGLASVQLKFVLK